MTLKEFRKNNPEYNDIPDLELADKFYKKFYSDQDETEYYKTLFPNIAAERAEDVYTDFVFPDDEFRGAFESESAFKPTTSEIAKQAGSAAEFWATTSKGSHWGCAGPRGGVAKSVGRITRTERAWGRACVWSRRAGWRHRREGRWLCLGTRG